MEGLAAQVIEAQKKNLDREKVLRDQIDQLTLDVKEQIMQHKERRVIMFKFPVNYEGEVKQIVLMRVMSEFAKVANIVALFHMGDDYIYKRVLPSFEEYPTDSTSGYTLHAHRFAIEFVARDNKIFPDERGKHSKDLILNVESTVEM